MKTTRPLGRLREAELAEVSWLVAQDPTGSLGYAPQGWPAETWILHGMWEDPDTTDTSASGRSVDQRWRDENPGRPAIGTLSYEYAPFTNPPPPHWRRLRWAELAERLGDPLTGGEWDGFPVPPCFRWFSTRSWPESIWTPSEGSMDEPIGERLLDVLAAQTVGGRDGECFAYYDVLDSPDDFEPLVLAGPLGAVFDAARHSTRSAATPDNIWPTDRSWLLWTEHDLWATRLIGSPEVVRAVEADRELETVPFTYRPRPPTPAPSPGPTVPAREPSELAPVVCRLRTSTVPDSG